jgi:small subunit ribosomal protein S3
MVCRWKIISEKLVPRHKHPRILMKKLPDAGIARIEIERTSAHIAVVIFSSKPGVIIGRSGTAIEDLKKQLNKHFGENFDLSIREIKNPDLDAGILAESVSYQLSRRVAFGGQPKVQ